MSFFGASSQHNASGPGFSQAFDPFAGLADGNGDAAEVDFEDYYDGLGDKLDDADDAFNDDTFGSSGLGAGAVGKDYDFFGQTAKVATVIEKEQAQFGSKASSARAVPAPSAKSHHTSAFPYNAARKPAAKPAATGYEKYKDEPVGELEVDAALWGVVPKKQPTPAPVASVAPPSAPSAKKKMLSLAEVEAEMLAQAAKQSAQPTPPAAPPAVPPLSLQSVSQPAAPHHGALAQESSQPGQPVAILRRPKSAHTPQPTKGHGSQQQQQQPQQPLPNTPIQILQNPNRSSATDTTHSGTPQQPDTFRLAHHHLPDSLPQVPVISHASQLVNLTDREKAAYMDQEARRAKRNHKIFLMSRDNGLMTPQDKSFISRIQLQQLVATTSNPTENGSDEQLASDFYYQVHRQIQGAQRLNSSMPLNNFAQTYLFQTGDRPNGTRRHHRGGSDNPLQRMDQQVQRAVEAAKNKPKSKQLVIEGSLGKISYSNAKTPRPLLNLKRADSGGDGIRPATPHRDAKTGKVDNPAADRMSTLRAVEDVYDTLMALEDHERTTPPMPQTEGDSEGIQRFMEWHARAQTLNGRLWAALKVHDPIGATPVHPFIKFLSYSKGKKAIPRVFRLITPEQRTTILTMIVVHLDQLDIIRSAHSDAGDLRFNSSLRENIDVFSHFVMTTLFNFMNELGLDMVSGFLGLVCRLNVDLIAKTRIGSSMLTIILSRAEIIKHGGECTAQSLQQWEATYTQFFNILEPSLPHIFPGAVNLGEDVHIWQFLAAIGIGASAEHQQRLVLAVKSRVMDTIGLAKTLPQDMASHRLQSVNLFMRSIGLDVELLQ